MKRLFVLFVAIFLTQVVKAGTFSGPSLKKSSNPSGEPGTIMIGGRAGKTVATLHKSSRGTDTYRNNIYKKRLDSIQKDVPLDYNEYVQDNIDTYLSAQRGDISREVGLAKYYFPIYEKAFRDAGIPDEIKYLSIVESQLNPTAVSRVGATGPWQFMGTTARLYGLKMDDYVDERRDPIQSSYAAAAYLKDAYQQFGDWLLAIASYNCGKSNVIEAIEKAGGATDYWSIRQYLPVETRGYVPAYIAITYVMNYYKKHNITPQECSFSTKTDTVSVDKFVSLNSVAHVLQIDLAQLSILNPAYVRMIINGSPEAPKRLVIPQSAKDRYSALYNSINCDLGATDIQFGLSSYDKLQHIEKRVPVHHKPRKFETLALQPARLSKVNKG
jgi:membrane-bound lytic murein transglycosylase D